MTELDRLYEDIERLLEKDYNTVSYKDSKSLDALSNFLAKNPQYSYSYLNSNMEPILLDPNNKSMVLRKGSDGMWNVNDCLENKVPLEKALSAMQQSFEGKYNSVKGRTPLKKKAQPAQPTAEEVTNEENPAPQDAEKAQSEEVNNTPQGETSLITTGNGNNLPSSPSQTGRQIIAQKGDYEMIDSEDSSEEGNEGNNGENGGVPATQEQINQEKNLSNTNGILSLENVPPDFWDSGYWVTSKAFSKNGDYYYETNNPEKRFRFTADESNPEQIKPIELQGIDSENKNWWKLASYKGNGQWELLDGMEKVDDADTWLQNLAVDLESQVKDLQAKLDAANKQLAEIPQEAAATLNTNTQLNYRLKSVIDSPDIQKQIDASPNGINYVGLNGDKISLVTMAESQILKEFNIPDFLLKLMEAKEVEISSLGSGGQTNLNVFLTPEIQEYLKTQKGNPTITKVMLGKDGLVWLMDDKNNPYLLDDMKVNDEVPAKDQQGNSFNVFINNGGANGSAGGAAGTGTGENGASGGNGNSPYGEITQLITRSELVEIKPQIQKKLNDAKNRIDLSKVNESIKKDGYEIKINSLKLSQAVKGTFLEDSKDWKQISEAKESKEEKEDKTEKAEPTQTTSGDTEVYVIEEFTLSALENQEGQEGQEGQESEQQTQEAQKVPESIESHFFNALKEAMELLREDDSVVVNNDQDTQDAKKQKEEKEARIKQVLDNITKITARSVSGFLNDGDMITLKIKTNDKSTFTGRKEETMAYAFAPGDESKWSNGYKLINEEEKIYKGWFTIMIVKGNPKETGATKFNRFMNQLTGVADMANKLSANRVEV